MDEKNIKLNKNQFYHKCMGRLVVINNEIKREFIEKIPPLFELFRPYHIINGFYEKNGEFWYQSHLSTIIIKDFVRHLLSFIFVLAPIAIINSLNTSIYYGGIICSKIVLNQLNNVEKARLFELLCIMDTQKFKEPCIVSRSRLISN